MFISDTAIKRPVLTVVAMLALVVFGAVALLQLDTDEFPEINAPIVVVAIPYPGASPDVVEREVIEPIEEVLSGISGVDRMRSSSLEDSVTGRRGSSCRRDAASSPSPRRSTSRTSRGPARSGHS